MMRWLEAWFGVYGARTVGAGVALVLGLVVLEYGLLRTLFLLMIVTLGWFVGSRIDEAGGLAEFYRRQDRRD